MAIKQGEVIIGFITKLYSEVIDFEQYYKKNPVGKNCLIEVFVKTTKTFLKVMKNIHQNKLDRGYPFGS